ncbi:CRISPR-associated endonuclease Cas1 [Orenia metallireducens]|uniref:CRISPR-associated endonuclease Cas1 n=1 Tax=Orenia metallireducens TaxID=1413210 RepID=A0A1C0A8C1_9FIRM|nr:CRISPR-associated endonuclease Cas1 [Orenia metallireducens]OCL26496.1 CRISPR-associated endonuclease Cas1 [Orenia metallireducens]
MPTVFITDENSTLVKRGERLVINKFGNKALDIPLIKVKQVIIFGNATITTSMIDTFLKFEIPVSFLSFNGKFRGRLMPQFSKNSILRKAQYKASEDRIVCLEIAKYFVVAKLNNLRTLLLRATRDDRSERAKKVIRELKNIITKAEKVESLDKLRGYEGLGSRKYFSLFNELLIDDFTFTKRSRRPPRDEVNALLSFGYMLLYNEVFNAVSLVGYDPYIGYLHQDEYAKPSLPLDLMEEFRPLIDNLIKRLINRQIIRPDDFIEKYGTYELTEKACKSFLQKFEEDFAKEIKHPLFEYKVTLRRAIELQARLLGKRLLGERDKYIPFEVR